MDANWFHRPRYFRSRFPAPWNKSGRATVTVRVGGDFEVYACVGYDRVPMRRDEAWALLAALEAALPATFGERPAWTHDRIDGEAA